MNLSKYVQLHQTCRICLRQEDKMVWMLENNDRVKNLYDLLSLIFESEIVFDKRLPNFICQQCESKLQNVRDLKTTLMRTNKILDECLKTAEMSPNDSIFVEDELYSLEKSVEIATKSEVNQDNSISEILPEEKIEEIQLILSDYDENDELLTSIVDDELFIEEKNIKLSQNDIETEKVTSPVKKIAKVESAEVKKAMDNTYTMYTTHKKCVKCDFIFKDSTDLEIHYEKHHKDLLKKICLICNKIIETDIKIHNRSHFKCVFCSKSYTDKKYLFSHLKSHCTEKSVKCNTCSIRFGSETALDAHRNLEHITNGKMKCPLCPVWFSHSLALKLHYSKYHKELMCNKCPAMFCSGEVLANHKCPNNNAKIVSKVRNFCDICKTRVRSIKEHNEKHHSDKSISNENVKKDNKTHLCNFCGKCLTSRLHLKEHMTIHTGEKPFACQFCDKQFRFKGMYNEHLKLHSTENPHICEICGKSFTSNKQFSKHKETHNEKSILCDVCPKKFHNISALKLHMRLHTGEKPCVCVICKKGFRTPYLLYIHKSSHKNEMKPCKLCGKTFKTKKTFAKHQKTHSDLKQFQCTMCDYETSDSFALTMHMKRRHPELNDEIGMFHHCDICKKTFSNAVVLNTHKQSKHADVFSFTTDLDTVEEYC